MNSAQILQYLDNVIQQPLLSKASEHKIPSSQPITELEQQELFISNEEYITAVISAVSSSLGNAGILPSLYLLGISPWEQAGFGMTVSVTTNIALLSVFSGLTLLLTIPMSYYAYIDYMLEAKTIIHEINKAEHERKHHRDSLFLSYLQQCLRNENLFDLCIKETPNENQTINKQALTFLVKEICTNPDLKTEYLNLNECLEIPNQKQEIKENLYTLLFDRELMKNNNIRDTMLKKISSLDPSFFSKLHACFGSIEKIPDYYIRPMGYGAVGATMVAGTLIGTVLTFAGIALTAGICASMPPIGWIILTLGCLAASLLIGIYIAKGKNINMKREALIEKLEDQNKNLIEIRHHIEKVNTRHYLMNEFKSDSLKMASPVILFQKPDAKIALLQSETQVSIAKIGRT